MSIPAESTAQMSEEAAPVGGPPKNLATGMNPMLSYSAEEHFGASQVHILKADCEAGRYVTMATFASF